MTLRFTRKRWTVVQVMLILLNVLATWLTLFVRSQANPLVAWSTGQYDSIRQRLRTGAINTKIVDSMHFDVQDLPSPMQLADYTFLATPRRDPSNTGMSRTMCLNINSISAPVMMLHYDDFWGTGARRAQIYYHSISAPNCQVLNVKPEWRDQCVADHHDNTTRCHQYVLEHFEELRQNESIRMRVERDIGGAGIPFLRCAERPLIPFKFKVDLLDHQTYWEGGENHVMIRTSNCRGLPLIRAQDQVYSLFQTVNEDDSSDVVVLLPPSGWLGFFVSWTHSIVTLILVLLGIKQALFRTNTVNYLPDELRITNRRPWVRYAVPWMNVIMWLSDNDRSVITFKGSMIIASDVWMTHWLYIWLSIADAVVNIRATYVILECAEYLLFYKFTLSNMVFLCSALVKVTWLMCLAQTVMRMVIKLGVLCLRSVRLLRTKTREKIEWNIDGISILLSYRIYYVILFLLTMTLVGIKGTPSFMVRDVPYMVGVYGGVEDLAGFWGSEVACDLITLLGMLWIISQCLGIGLMYTKYKEVADNNLMRLLQSRYIVSGWDGLLAAHVLGLDPSDPKFCIDGHAHSQSSVGALLQLLYLSGPSGLVHLAGDYIFHDNGFSKDPIRFRFPIVKARAMGLFTSAQGSETSSGLPSTTMTSYQVGPSTNKLAGQSTKGLSSTTVVGTTGVPQRSSIFDRQLRLVKESYVGKLFLIDAAQTGQVTTNKETGNREYEVIDALTTMTILDIKHLMGREKKLRIQ